MTAASVCYCVYPRTIAVLAIHHQSHLSRAFERYEFHVTKVHYSTSPARFRVNLSNTASKPYIAFSNANNTTYTCFDSNMRSTRRTGMSDGLQACTVLRILLILMLSPAAVVVYGTVPTIFYPFGTDQGDAEVPPNDDYSSDVIPISDSGFPFFGVNHLQLYVNTNGDITFANAYDGYTANPFPLQGQPMIALFWTDIDTTRNDGRIYYRQSTDAVLLSRASADIRATFSTSGLSSFSATWIFIATWLDVTYFYGSPTTPVNSFQCVLITDGAYSFAMMNYATLTWTKPAIGTTPAQVGFNAGDGKNYYAVPTSRTDDIVNIGQQSNIDVTGRWIFRVDQVQIGDAGCQFTPACSRNVSTGLCLDSGLCFYYGSQHFTSFDGRMFDYQGVCRHLLVGLLPDQAATTLPSFQVFGRNEYRDGYTAVSWFHDVEIVYGNENFQLIRGASLLASATVVVKVNGVVVNLPYCQSTYAIYNSGSYVRFQTTFGLAVETNGFTVNIYVPSTYRSLLHGLCGNFDGASVNDLVHNNVDYSANSAQFGDFYIFPDDSSTTCSDTPSSPPLCCPLPELYTTRCQQLIDSAGPFGQCVASIDATVPGTSTILYNNCLLDACYANESVICQNVFSLVEECAFRGFQIDCDLWQTTTQCPVVCSTGMVFECNSNRLCMPTCNNPIVSAKCTRAQKGACVCPIGQLLDNGACTSSCPTGCVDSSFKIRPVGTTWSGFGCIRQLTCSLCTDCLYGHQIVPTVIAGACAADQFCNIYGQCETISTTTATPTTTTTTATTTTTTTPTTTTTLPETTTVFTTIVPWTTSDEVTTPSNSTSEGQPPSRRRHCGILRLIRRLRRLNVRIPQSRLVQQHCSLLRPLIHRLRRLERRLQRRIQGLPTNRRL